jgi:hypothetical protein
VVEGLHLSRLGGEEHGSGAGVGDGLPGLGELDALDPLLGDEEGNGLVCG